MQPLMITKKGQELMAKLISGDATVQFVNMQTSSRDYSGTDLAVLTSLEDVKQEVLISGVSVVNDTTVEILARIDNEKIEEGYYIQTIGLFAEDSDGNTVLYTVSIADEVVDYMPLFEGTTPTGYSYTFDLLVSNASAVSLTIDPAAVPTPEQIEEINRKLDTKLSATGDSADNTVTFDSDDTDDAAKITAWTDVAALTSGEKHASILKKISNMFKNLRYLYKLLGTADISAIGDGSVTGALSSLNSNSLLRKGMLCEDIANCLDAGVYIIVEDQKTICKTPNNQAGTLIVFTNGYATSGTVQLFIPWNPEYYPPYIRTYYNNRWYGWAKFETSV